MAEYSDVVGKWHVVGHLGGCVVVAGDREYGDFRILQPTHLLHEIEASSYVIPVAVV